MAKPKRYRIEIHGEIPWQFREKDHSAAAREIRMALGIRHPLDEKKLKDNGVRRITCNEIEIPLEAFRE
ncbi:MAG: hypothetical protein KGJ13_04230 [Patescibacteria group bacterium]|nr:hypothetical protein [Patescibacteria group bacterium]